jgi:hypothetical protein
MVVSARPLLTIRPGIYHFLIGAETKAPCSAFLHRCPIIAHLLAARGPERGEYAGGTRLFPLS